MMKVDTSNYSIEIPRELYWELSSAYSLNGNIDSVIELSKEFLQMESCTIDPILRINILDKLGGFYERKRLKDESLNYYDSSYNEINRMPQEYLQKNEHLYMNYANALILFNEPIKGIAIHEKLFELSEKMNKYNIYNLYDLSNYYTLNAYDSLKARKYLKLLEKSITEDYQTNSRNEIRIVVESAFLSYYYRKASNVNWDDSFLQFYEYIDLRDNCSISYSNNKNEANNCGVNYFEYVIDSPIGYSPFILIDRNQDGKIGSIDSKVFVDSTNRSNKRTVGFETNLKRNGGSQKLVEYIEVDVYENGLISFIETTDKKIEDKTNVNSQSWFHSKLNDRMDRWYVRIPIYDSYISEKDVFIFLKGNPLFPEFPIFIGTKNEKIILNLAKMGFYE